MKDRKNFLIKSYLKKKYRAESYLKKVDVNELLRDYISGMPIKQICYKHNKDRSTLYKYLHLMVENDDTMILLIKSWIKDIYNHGDLTNNIIDNKN